jgi:hypothetical protein
MLFILKSNLRLTIYNDELLGIIREHQRGEKINEGTRGRFCSIWNLALWVGVLHLYL